MSTNRVSEDTPIAPAPRAPRIWQAPRFQWLILAAIVLLAASFSTLNLFGWDEDTHLHPDERFMTTVADRLKMPTSLAEYLDSARNPLNPRNSGNTFYVYGLLPQTLTHVTAVALTPREALPPTVRAASPTNYDSAALVPNPDLRFPSLKPLQMLLNPHGRDLTSYWYVHWVGRAWSALFHLLSVVVVFLIGRRLYGWRVGLLAALFLALSVLPIQLAHFFTVDSATAFFTLLAVYCAVRIAQDGGPGSFVGLGVSIGAAMACRVTMATLGLLGVLAVLLRIWGQQESRAGVGRRPRAGRWSSGVYAAFGLLALAGALSIVSFRMFQPDAFIGTSFFDVRPDPRFLENIKTIGGYVSGELDSPPSQQWASRTPYLFPLKNMILWGMGLPLGLVAWIGWAAAGAQMALAAWSMLNNAGLPEASQRLRRRLRHLLPWSWITFYFAWQGGQFGMTMRYYLLLYSLLALFAAWFLVALLRRRPANDNAFWPYVIQRWMPVAGRVLLVAVAISTFAWAYAFTRIYTRPHSRIAASRWIYAHIPAGSALTSEEWDDWLPLSIDGYNAGQYHGVKMQPYGEDDEIKYTGYTTQNGTYAPGLFDQLDQADYIILSSNRVYDSATRLPMRYPALTRYYHYLFSGELGFEQVADITSYPRLFGIEIPDQSAEEAFSVYDHPRVLIFKKTPRYTRERAEQLIAGNMAWNEVYKLPTARASRVPTALRLTEAQWPAYRAAGTWADLFNPASLANQVPWLPWLLVLELLGLAVVPLLFRLLPGLPDRGFALAKTLGLLLVAYGAWLLGSIGANTGAPLVAFSPFSVWLCAGLLIALGGLVGWLSRAELLAFVRRRRAAVLVAEGLFLLAFFGFLCIRALNPDLWHPARGGEKPMDLTFLTAVLKSPSFPPYDPWFAGGYINYYYFGFVFVGALIHLTGIVPTTAYNLAVPTLFGLTALGSWGVAYNLVALQLITDKETRRQGDKGELRQEVFLSPRLPVSLSRRWGAQERWAIVAGVVAAVFVVLVGNLAQALWYLPGSATPSFPGLPAECQVSTYAVQQVCRGRTEWAFWDATRLVGMNLQDSTITEFPFFTFLYADLHAHMIALPLALAALGLMVALARTKNRHPQGQQRTEQRWSGPWLRCLFFALCSLFLLALVVGALRATNTWDFPTYLGLGVLTLGLVAWRSYRRGVPWPHVGLRWALSSLGLLVGSTLLFAPFTRHFATDYAGFMLWNGSHTAASDFLKINGLWLFMLLSGTLLLYRRARRTPTPRLMLIGGAALLLAAGAIAFKASALMLLVPLSGAAIGLFVDLVLGSEAARWSAAPADLGASPRPAGPLYVQLPLPMTDQPPEDSESALPWQPERSANRRSTQARASLVTLLPTLWGLAALLVALATEVIVAKGDIGRMNTVFKFGMQSWVLFAIVAALAFTAVWRALGERSQRTKNQEPRTRRPYIGSRFSVLGSPGLPVVLWGWRAAAALLIAAALVYPLTATPARLADRIDERIGPTLDGTAYMRSDRGSWSENNTQFSFVEDAEALDWMRQHVSGTPIVLEAHTEAYRWGGRVSIYTGLPTLLGWPWHETQQRSVANAGPVLASRQSLIQQLYSIPSGDEALKLLRLYGVEYVYVGPLERALYDPAGLAKFDTLAQAGQIQPVYTAGSTRIYQVPRAAGDPPPALLTTSLPVRAPALPMPKNLLLDVPVYKLPPVNEYAWNRLADSQVVAVLLWLLACYILLALGLPPAMLVFGRWRDGGYTWGRLIGLLLLGYAVWLPVSVGLWRYNRWGLLLGMMLVLALDAGILFRIGKAALDDQEPVTPSPRHLVTLPLIKGLRLLRDHLIAHRRSILVVEALFLGAFAFMTTLRAFNPDLWQPFWGGEKPFEFGFLNAILRSPVMPPYDPFFSDGVINYYYYGLFLASLPIKATGIAPAVAFNLVVPTLFALTLVGAFTIVTQLTGLWRWGLSGAAFVGLIGNLAAAFPVTWSQGLRPVRQALENGGLSGFGQRLDAWFVGPSRVIPNTINEFPFWSYLFADLHPHLIAMPITLLVVALAYELFDERRTVPALDRWFLRSAQDKLLLVGPWSLAALALGALAVTNSWDFPTYTLLLGGALLGRAWRAKPAARSRIADLAIALAITGGIAVGALLLYLPFFQRFQAFEGGGGGIGRVSGGSPIGGYVLIYGLFLAILVLWVFGMVGRLLSDYRGQVGSPLVKPQTESAAEQTAVLGIVARPHALDGSWRIVRLALLSVLPLLLIVGVWQPMLVLPLAEGLWSSTLLLKLGLSVLFLTGIAVLLVRRLSAVAWFVLWMAVVAWAVSLGVEFIYIRDHLAGGDWYRMNTVFKFGLQAWVLMALAAAAALPRLARRLHNSGVLAQAAAWLSVLALVALALIFPLVGIPSRLAYRFPQTTGPTLDGLAFMDQATYDWQGIPINLRADGDAIRWLNRHISGTPIVLQSSLEFYRAYGVRVAANTGLPTIVSPLHASEQHDPGQVSQRDLDVQRIYTTFDQSEALQLLAKYHVGYIYVGPIERHAYGQGVSKFDQMVGAYLSTAYQNEAVAIFKVNDGVYSLALAPPVPISPPAPAAAVAQPAPKPNQLSLETLEALVAADPTAPGLAFDLAQRYRNEGRFDEAAAVLAKAANAHPQDVALQQLLGDLLRDTNQLEEAEAAYRAAIAAAPNAGNYNKLGTELLNWGQLDKAAEAFAQAIAADVNLAEPYYHLGEIYEKQGKADQAIEQYTRYLNLASPDDQFRGLATAALERLKQ